MTSDPFEKKAAEAENDDLPEPENYSTRIIAEKSRYVLGLLQTRISNLKQELQIQKEAEVADSQDDSNLDPDKLLEDARVQVRNLEERLARSKEPEAEA